MTKSPRYLFTLMMTDNQIANLVEHIEDEIKYCNEQELPVEEKDWKNLLDELIKINGLNKLVTNTPFTERRK